MATTDSSALSKTLQSISAIKIAELDKKRISFANKKKEVLSDLEGREHAVGTRQDRVLRLLEAAEDLSLPGTTKDELDNIRRFTEHSTYDPSISEDELVRYEELLRSRLDFESKRLDYAKLLSTIITDHLRPRGDTDDPALKQEPSTLEDSFEILEKDRLQQLRRRFEEIVFTPELTDEVEISVYLESLFEGDIGELALKTLRKTLNSESLTFLRQEKPFTSGTVDWVIDGLLRNELLKGEKKQLLRTFRTDDVVIDEICDVLNMRWAVLQNWEWREDSAGLDVEPRKQLNGKYRVVMDEDVLQAMLVHYIGSKFCVMLKERFTEAFTPLLKKPTTIPESELDRRQFYLAVKNGPSHTLEKRIHADFFEDFFLSNVPSDVRDERPYDEDADENSASQKGGIQIKQQLLRHIASEVLLRRSLHGDVAVIQSDLKWFATSIPHSTLFACLRFMGLPEEWLAWFRKYVEVPLNMSKAAGEPQSVKRRKRGVPISHAMEKFLGEAILVFLDLVVKKEAGLLMYRMHDDLFLCGPSSQCAKAWAATKDFVKVMGVEINEKKTGSVCFRSDKNGPTLDLPDGDVAIDFLKLTPDHGWVIDENRVNAHVRQLRVQLDQCDSILGFILTYNSCIGRFFGHTFGLPATCLGRQHIDSILRTHERMQRELFGGHGVAAALRSMLDKLAARYLDVSPNFQVLDSFIFAPPEIGGLGVTNPFISLLLTRETLDKDPMDLVKTFMTKEKRDFDDARAKFDQLNTHRKKRRRNDIFGADEGEGMVDLDGFLTFDEYTRYREVTSSDYATLYGQLMEQPTKQTVRIPYRVVVGRLNSEIYESEEKKYLVAMYADELCRNFGGISIIDGSLAPLGVMKAIKDQKVVWQMVL